MSDFEGCSMFYAKNRYRYVKAAFFLDYIAKNLDEDTCAEIEELTVKQDGCPLWWEMRYGRITASKIWSARSEITPSAMKGIKQRRLDVNRYQNEAMLRGKRLEPEIRQIVAKRIGKHVQSSGLVLNPRYPALAASPDGIGDDFVVEIKSPTNCTTFKTFYKGDDNIPNPYLWQLRTHMLLAEKKIGYYCIADPNFEVNKKVTIVKIDQDLHAMKSLISNVMKSWRRDVYYAKLHNENAI